MKVDHNELNFTKDVEVGYIGTKLYDQSTKPCNRYVLSKFLKFGEVEVRNFVGNEC